MKMASPPKLLSLFAHLQLKMGTRIEPMQKDIFVSYLHVHVCACAYIVSVNHLHMFAAARNQSLSSGTLPSCLFVVWLVVYVLLTQGLSLVWDLPGHQGDYAECPANPRDSIISPALTGLTVCATMSGFKIKVLWNQLQTLLLARQIVYQ